MHEVPAAQDPVLEPQLSPSCTVGMHVPQVSEDANVLHASDWHSTYEAQRSPNVLSPDGKPQLGFFPLARSSHDAFCQRDIQDSAIATVTWEPLPNMMSGQRVRVLERHASSVMLWIPHSAYVR